MIPPKNKGKTIVKVGALSYARLVKLMLEGIYNCDELAEETGLHYVTVLHYTRELHKVGAAHICDWDKDRCGRDALKIYKLGEGKDKSRHKTPSKEISRRYRARLKSQETIHMMAG